jgi:RNA-directed DNA polymerase
MNKEQQSSRARHFLEEVTVKPNRPSWRADMFIATQQSEQPMFNKKLMEEICEKNNLQRAYERVCRNKGAPGIDNITVEELDDYLKANWPEIKARLLHGHYTPQPVRRVEIPKPQGKGKRKLGIPCVLDRFIQQAILQIIQKLWDSKFSKSSFGFRPGKSAHQAIAQAQQYVQEGYRIVVDIDLENFFDEVNHDKLMSKLAKEIEDKRVLKLLRAYLNAGVMENGLTHHSTTGVPQGSPLSPFLSNVVLDELDKELEKRGHKFARYADDANVYVRSKRAGTRVMNSITLFITQHLKLKINKGKSAVDSPSKRSFLGFRIVRNPQYVIGLSSDAVKRFKSKVRRLTRRRWSISMEERIEILGKYLKGWKAYYGLCETHTVFQMLDSWIRHRLRSIYWKQWKVYKCRKSELIKRGIHPEASHCTAWSARGHWRMGNVPEVRMALNNRYFDSMGLPRLELRTTFN